MTEYKRRQKASIEKSLYGGIKTNLDDFPELLDTTQVALYLNVSVSTVRKLISNGKLPIIKVTGKKTQRIHREDLRAYVDDNRRNNNYCQ